MKVRAEIAARPLKTIYAVLMPLVTGLTVVLASTALAGVLAGLAWLADVTVAVLVITVVGIGLHALRMPTAVIPIVQLFALLCLVTLLFSTHGVLFVLPSSAALGDLSHLLVQSMDVIRSAAPPVVTSPPLLCLVVLILGVVAILVNGLAVLSEAPAAAGLLLLCVYAVPASLDDDLLPWWSFVLGAGGFALLLGVDQARRHQAWRGRMGLAATKATGSGPAALAITGMALAIALIIGTQSTFIGTAGRLPGSGNSAGHGMSGQLGIKPFTTLRGMLDHNEKPVELFRIRGLNDGGIPYLRSLTLRTYRDNEGWVITEPMPQGMPASEPLPPGPGDSGDGPTTTVRIEPVSWTDVWMPVYPVPRQLSQITGDWHYDSDTGIVYSQRQRHPMPYVEQAMLAEPSAAQLRSTVADYGSIDASYLSRPAVNPRITQLAQQLTVSARTPFDKAEALYTYFATPGNGFTYSTQTAAASTPDAMYDFLFTGKTGFCEQYASAMALLLREVGIPSRVAIGFTAGSAEHDYRSITSRDAHAWVEVFFPGYGWLPFDPTPLADGRNYVPSYLATGRENSGAATTPNQHGRNESPSAADTMSPAVQTPSGQAGAGPTPDSGGDLVWVVVGCAALAALLTILALVRRTRLVLSRLPKRINRSIVPAAMSMWIVAGVVTSWLLSWWLVALLIVLVMAAAPSMIRELRRRRRLDAVARLGADAATAAWTEILAESHDRGALPNPNQTVRNTVRELNREHRLDEKGEHGLRSLAAAVERAWYGSRAPQPDLPEVLDEVRAGFARSAPLALRARLFPRSVLARKK